MLKYLLIWDLPIQHMLFQWRIFVIMLNQKVQAQIIESYGKLTKIQDGGWQPS